MLAHTAVSGRVLRGLIRRRQVCLAGNARLKIYGSLACSSGQRMKRANRVFFRNAAEAQAAGFRPCGNCLTHDYQRWICSTH